MRDFYRNADALPLDQADGLRRMFAGRGTCVIPLVSNPFAAFPSVVIERLTAAAALLGRHTLVVDAADQAPAPDEMARLDLSACVETLAPDVSYLAARGLAMDYVDTRGTAAAFLEAVANAAPQADLVLVHANASDLARMFVRRSARPMLIGADHPDSIKHAYAAIKLLAQRCGLMTYHLLLAASPSSPRLKQIATSLSQCADNFLGCLLHDWAVIDPASDPAQAPSGALQRLLDAQLRLRADVLPHSLPAVPAQAAASAA